MIRAVFETHGVRMQIAEQNEGYEIRVIEDAFDRAQTILYERGILGGETEEDDVESEEEPEVEFQSDGGALPVPETSYDARLVSPHWFTRALSRLRGLWNR